MNSFVQHPQKLKCPKCGKTEITTAGCVPNFQTCPKCGTLMKPCVMGLLDKILSRFKA